MQHRWWNRLGPGLLVTAAFIGPGTVLTASVAGAQYGGALVWVVLFAMLAAIVLQEMAARLGLVTRRGLGEVLVESFPHPLARRAMVTLVLSAILLGNAAYQAGNLTGAAIGLQSLLGGSAIGWVGVGGVTAMLLLWFGAYAAMQRALVILVAVMSFVFVTSAALVLPQLAKLPSGALQWGLPAGSLWTAIGLLGTTVVPYNLFLHARSVQEKWAAEVPLEVSLKEARWDTILAILLGGVMTIAVLLTAVVSFYASGRDFSTLTQAADQLVPVVGIHAKWLFALGLFGAGLTSAITAPLAAAYATAGCLGWNGLSDKRFRRTAICVVLIGLLAAVLGGGSPRVLILFAQGANGLLLPIVAIFLIVTMNRRALLGEHVNGKIANLLGWSVALLVAILGLRKLWQLW